MEQNKSFKGREDEIYEKKVEGIQGMVHKHFDRLE